MKVLIMFPPVHSLCNTLGMRSMPPLSIYYLSSILKSEGFEVELIDPSFFNNHNFFMSYDSAFSVIRKLLSKQYDVISISSNTGNWPIAKIVIDLIRNIDTQIPIIVGGLHATYFDEYVLKTTGTNIVIRGEGEITFPKLLGILNNNNKLHKLKGISFRDSNGQIFRNDDSELICKEGLADYPYPDFTDLPKNIYSFLPLETSRGCKYNCIFCSVSHRKSWRSLGKDIVLERINKVKYAVNEKIIGGKDIYLVDDCFSADIERALDILYKIHEQNLGLKFGIECRVTDLLNSNFYHRIPKDILSFMQIGVECGYDEGLRKVRKGITTDNVLEYAKLSSRNGVNNPSLLNFIIGFPWEGIEEIKKTVHFAGYVSSTYGINCALNWLWLCPSDLWKDREKYRINVTEEIFDNPLWTVSKEIFLKTHPLINMRSFSQIEDLINEYQLANSYIQHTRLWQ